MEYEFLVNESLQKIKLEKKGDRFLFSDGRKDREVDIQVISPHQVSLLIGNRSILVHLAREKGRWYLCLDGRHYLVEEPSEEPAVHRKGEELTPEGLLLVKAPMPGKVIKVSVSLDEEVRKNQTLAIVEAMKMENEIKASTDGRIKNIHVRPGDLVDADKPLIELEPSPTS